jgi:general transcription factor 3C polypeptide 5 (transcription factor C subunit 1)
VDKIRQFKFNPERGWKKNEELIPPPILTHHVLPFNWGWHQNPNIIQTVNQTTGESALLNRSRSRKFQIEYLGHNAEDTPQKSPFEVPNDPDLQKLIIELKEALEERPLWTRRALANRIGNSPQFYLFKFALQYVGYQFKGGPFRDVVIKFGIDPRTDSKYRMYQTIFFKLYEEEEKGPFRKWHDNRSISLSKRTKLKDLTTHLFDGKSLTLDGKVWQFCDITDPFLANLIKNAPVCHEFSSTGDGYFYNGSWAKIRAVMKLKLAAIRLGKTINDADFDVIHKIPDIVEDNKKISNKIGVPLPDIKLTDEEREKLRAKGLGSLGGSIRRGDAKGKARKTRLRDRHAGERRAKSLEAQKAGGLPSLLPSIGTSVLDPALSRVDPHGVDGVDQDVQAGNGEGMEAGDDMDIDDDEDSGLEDEDSDDVDGDGESDLDDDRLRGADEEGNGSNVEDVTDYSKYYIPRVAPAER